MKIYGDLERRIQLNRQRLLDDAYRAPLIFEQSSTWPGDWPGRTILALTSLYQIVHTDEERMNIKNQLNDIIKGFPENLNRHGFFGKTLNLEAINEQQLSGNSWFLRGLCTYYVLFKDPYVFGIIQSIIDNYLIFLKEPYQTYPLVHREAGRVDGHILEETYDGWLLSSDIGCAFIMLDGMTQAYQITKDNRLKPVIEAMIEKFVTIDLVKQEFQTHAALSASRGIYRYYEITQDQRYLKYVVDIFELYINSGMTLNYANLNWFNRKTWTEICAVVDSFILAKRLFLELKTFRYLELMDRIYQNAIISGQRDNGGAGCETCLLTKDDELKMFMFEAYFCCSMRLAEGLKEKATSMILPYEKSFIITALEPLEYMYDETLITIKQEESSYTISTQGKSIDHFYIYMPKESVLNIGANKDYIKVKNKDDVVIIQTFKPYQEVIKGETLHFIGNKLQTIKNDENNHTPILDASQLKQKDLEKVIQKL